MVGAKNIIFVFFKFFPVINGIWNKTKCKKYPGPDPVDK